MKRRAKENLNLDSQRRFRQLDQASYSGASSVRSSESGGGSDNNNSAATDVVVAATDGSMKSKGGSINLNYPHPKNFAERLMNILEKGIESDCIWWIGGGVDGVALQPKKVKKGSLLQKHFSGNKYSAFLRSFNRWGFRRVSSHDDRVPDGAVVYKNCLFRMDRPHLVKHMRMDSDVQDVFKRHQESSDGSGSQGPRPSHAVASLPAVVAVESPPISSAPVLPNGNNNAPDMLQLLLGALSNSQQQQPLPSQYSAAAVGALQNSQDPLPGAAKKPPLEAASKPKGRKPAKRTKKKQQKAPRASDLRPPPEATLTDTSNSVGAIVNVNANSSMDHRNTVSPSGSIPNSAPSSINMVGGVTTSAAAPSSTNQVNINGNALASALELLVRQMQAPKQEEPPPEPQRNVLLRRILECAKAYLAQPQSSSSSVSGSAIRSTLELLQMIGTEELEGKGQK